MDLKCQQEVIEKLESCKDSNIHSLIIYGSSGSGKSYLAKRYADILDVSDFYLIHPKVTEIRDVIEECSQINSNVVLCIENLDTGVFAASSALLKFLEEPAHNVYIVVTARNLKLIQETIISRSYVVGVNIPTKGDLVLYAEDTYPEEYRLYNNRDIWNCVQTFEDVNTVLAMNSTQIQYIEELPELCLKSKCISDTLWSLQKYPENLGDTPINLTIRYIMYKQPKLLYSGINCIRSLEQKRIADYVILTKFLFEFKGVSI